jgi:hypothetical protein
LHPGPESASTRRQEREKKATPEAPSQGPESYTDRLMRAKQKVWEEREKDKPKDKGKPEEPHR